MMKVVLLATLGLGATIAGASTARWSSTSSQEPSTGTASGSEAALASAEDPTSASRSTPQLYSPVLSLDDLKGATLGLPDGERVQILEFQWGLDDQSKLFPATVAFLTEDGMTVRVDQRDRAIRVFDDYEDMSGFFMDIGNGSLRQIVWVDKIQFGIRHDGALVRLGLAGSTLEGQAFDELMLPDDPIAACACVFMLNCSTNSTCTECQGPAANCACTAQGGSGRCNMVTECHCPADGYCPTGQNCEGQIVNNVASCACKS